MGTSMSNGPIKKGGWTVEEDKQIQEHGESVRDEDWSSLAQKLPGRIPNQCRRRFKRLSNIQQRDYVKVDMSDVKDKKMTTWTAEEDKVINNHVQKYGECKWKLVAKQLPGRRGVDCKKHWFKSDVAIMEVDDGIKDIDNDFDLGS